MLGSDELVPRSLSGRKLQVKDVPCCRKKYNKNLLKLEKQYCMPEKLEKIRQCAVEVAEEPDDSSVKLEDMKEINRFDKQFKELMLRTKNTCRKK